MIKKNLFLIFSLIFLCCQHSTDFGEFPPKTRSIVFIDKVKYEGEAYIASLHAASPAALVKNDFLTEIYLILDDSTQIGISSENFAEGVFHYTLYQDIVFTLYDWRKSQPFYSGKEGILSLVKVTPDQIIGEFKITVFDASSSCSDCPEIFRKTEGKFNAVKQDQPFGLKNAL